MPDNQDTTTPSPDTAPPPETLRIKQSDLKPVGDLEMVPATLGKFNVDRTSEPSSQIILLAEERKFLYSFTEFEGAGMTFARSKCFQRAVFHNPYQHFLDAQRHRDLVLHSVAFEAKEGDLYYAGLRFLNSRNKSEYVSCSGGDALVYVALTGAKLLIPRTVLEEMPDADWPFDEEIAMGFDDEDAEDD